MIRVGLGRGDAPCRRRRDDRRLLHLPVFVTFAVIRGWLIASRRSGTEACITFPAGQGVWLAFSMDGKIHNTQNRPVSG